LLSFKEKKITGTELSLKTTLTSHTKAKQLERPRGTFWFWCTRRKQGKPEIAYVKIPIPVKG